MKMMSVTPASIASSTAYWIRGLSTMGSISLGLALVAGRKRVPRPATGKTAFLTLCMMHLRQGGFGWRLTCLAGQGREGRGERHIGLFRLDSYLSWFFWFKNQTSLRALPSGIQQRQQARFIEDGHPEFLRFRQFAAGLRTGHHI